MNEFEWHLLEDKPPLESVRVANDIELRRGDRVRLRPRAGGDVMDLALARQDRRSRVHRTGLRGRGSPERCLGRRPRLRH